MKWTLAGIAGSLALVAIELHPVPADACGVKLTIKTSAPRRAIARTSNPSRVLLVGSPPRRLERDLAAAGHAVEVVPDPSSAKRDSYAVVIVDNNDQAKAAHARFGSAVVVVRTKDAGADLRAVEDQVARRPTQVATKGQVVAALPTRVPVAAGPAPETRTLAAVKPDTEPTTVAAIEPPPTVKPTTTAVPPPVKPPQRKQEDRIVASTPKVDESPRIREPKPDTATPSSAGTKDLRQELYFSINSAKPQNMGQITQAARWLTAHADVNVVIEGHADPSGTPEANMALSQTRAEAVRDALVAAGIDQSRLEVLALGDTHVKYGASDSRNRRVAITVKK